MVDDSIAEAISNLTLETMLLKLFEPDADSNKVFINTLMVNEHTKFRV